MTEKENTMMMRIELIVNCIRKTFSISPTETLLSLLRRAGYKGVKQGCGSGDCGACAVLVDSRAVNACLTMAAKADGRQVTTIEGLAEINRLHPLQQAFLDEGAVQCGYCTPGMIIAAAGLLMRNSNPTETEVKEAIAGNLCRCTGYIKPVNAIMRAAQSLREKEEDECKNR